MELSTGQLMWLVSTDTKNLISCRLLSSLRSEQVWSNVEYVKVIGYHHQKCELWSYTPYESDFRSAEAEKSFVSEQQQSLEEIQQLHGLHNYKVPIILFKISRQIYRFSSTESHKRLRGIPRPWRCRSVAKVTGTRISVGWRDPKSWPF